MICTLWDLWNCNDVFSHRKDFNLPSFSLSIFFSFFTCVFYVMCKNWMHIKFVTAWRSQGLTFLVFYVFRIFSFYICLCCILNWEWGRRSVPFLCLWLCNCSCTICVEDFCFNLEYSWLTCLVHKVNSSFFFHWSMPCPMPVLPCLD